MAKEEDFKDDPPVKMGNSIESRCLLHPNSYGSNYREHLEEHRPGVEA